MKFHKKKTLSSKSSEEHRYTIRIYQINSVCMCVCVDVLFQQY